MAHPARPLSSSRSPLSGVKRPADVAYDAFKAHPNLKSGTWHPESPSGTLASAPKKHASNTEWEAVMSLTSFKAEDDTSSDSDREGRNICQSAATPCNETSPVLVHHSANSQLPLVSASPFKTNPSLLKLPPLLRLPVATSPQRVAEATPQPRHMAALVGAGPQFSQRHLGPVPAASISPSSSCGLATDASAGAEAGQSDCDTCLSLSAESPREGCRISRPKAVKAALPDLTLWPSSAKVGPQASVEHQSVAVSPSGSSSCDEGLPSGPSTPCSVLPSGNDSSTFNGWSKPAQHRTMFPDQGLRSRPPQPIGVQHVALFPEIQLLGTHWDALLARMQEHAPEHSLRRSYNGSGAGQREQLGGVVHSEEYKRLAQYLDSLVFKLQQQRFRQGQDQKQQRWLTQGLPQNNHRALGMMH